jgi:hypothetical protein
MIRKTLAGICYVAGALDGLLASLKLTIVLLALSGTALVCAILVESAKGRECAQWYVYHREWFVGLLGVLAANIAAATVVRFSWRWNRLAQAIASVGLLVLLAGFIQTLV